MINCLCITQNLVLKEEVEVKSLLGTCLRVVPVFMLPVWAPMPCPSHFSQTLLKLPGETVTGSYTLHTPGSLFGPQFSKNFPSCMRPSPSWLTHLLPSKVWICSPAHMLPLFSCLKCLQGSLHVLRRGTTSMVLYLHVCCISCGC